MDFTLSVLANLVAAAVLALLGYVLGRQGSRKRYRSVVRAAPERYLLHLDNLIGEAVEEGSRSAIVNARAIVSMRNDLRKTLLSVSATMNSDIDRLAEQISSDDVGTEALFETMQVLAKKWPAKKTQIEYEVRKIVAELGFERY